MPINEIYWTPASITPPKVDFAKTITTKCGAIGPGNDVEYANGLHLQVQLDDEQDYAPTGKFLVGVTVGVAGSDGHTAEPMGEDINYSLDDGVYHVLTPYITSKWSGDWKIVQWGYERGDGSWGNLPLDAASFEITGPLPAPKTITLRLPVKSDGTPINIEIKFTRGTHFYVSPLNGC